MIKITKPVLFVAFLIVFISLAIFFFKENKFKTIEDEPRAISSLSSKYKESLEKRVQEYNAFIKEGKYSDAYGYLSENYKAELPKETILKDIQKYTLGEVITKDDTLYVKSIRTACENNDCTKKITLQGYKKWVFEKGNWYLTNDAIGCIRDIPYAKPAEFDRALSLYTQRINSYRVSKGLEEEDYSYFNCLNIQYSDSINEEGFFTFDSNGSSVDDLQIFVNSSYKEKDDMLTAFLLSHEIYHVFSYLNEVIYGDKLDCIDEEVNAFSNQLFFSQTLNQQEKDILNLRFQEGYYQISPPLKMMWDLWAIKKNADQICGSDSNCYDKQLTGEIKNKVKSNPYYQKQCGI